LQYRSFRLLLEVRCNVVDGIGSRGETIRSGAVDEGVVEVRIENTLAIGASDGGILDLGIGDTVGRDPVVVRERKRWNRRIGHEASFRRVRPTLRRTSVIHDPLDLARARDYKGRFVVREQLRPFYDESVQPVDVLAA